METTEAAFLKSFRQRIIKKIKENPADYFLCAIFLIFLGIVLYQRFILGWMDWLPCTGIGSFINEDGKLVRGKTLWDLAELLVIPLGGAYIAFRFSKSLKKNEQKIADERRIADLEIAIDQQREIALQNYYDRMSELLLRKDGGLRESKKDEEIRVIAQARTLSTMRSLDVFRKGSLVKFLHEAKLIVANSEIIDLSGCDLSDICLENAQLEKASLNNINFKCADFYNADLTYSNLSSSSFEDAMLKSAVLSKSYLCYAKLKKANLIAAILVGADLEGADLTEANLSFAVLDGAILNNVNFRGATMPDCKEYDPEIHTIQKLTAK